uniref:Uncharacterized protein n=1 Tax=Arion vulgaris TaxID=1028688 RepID=A0A0B7AI68_9EUPU
MSTDLRDRERDVYRSYCLNCASSAMSSCTGCRLIVEYQKARLLTGQDDAGGEKLSALIIYHQKKMMIK